MTFSIIGALVGLLGVVIAFAGQNWSALGWAAAYMLVNIANAIRDS